MWKGNYAIKGFFVCDDTAKTTRWDGLVVYMITRSGHTAMLTCQKKVFKQQGVSAW